MKIARVLSLLASASLAAGPVAIQAAPAQIERGSEDAMHGSELRGIHFLLIAVVLAAILAVALGGKGHNNPVSS